MHAHEHLRQESPDPNQQRSSHTLPSCSQKVYDEVRQHLLQATKRTKSSPTRRHIDSISAAWYHNSTSLAYSYIEAHTTLKSAYNPRTHVHPPIHQPLAVLWKARFCLQFTISAGFR